MAMAVALTLFVSASAGCKKKAGKPGPAVSPPAPVMDGPGPSARPGVEQRCPAELEPMLRKVWLLEDATRIEGALCASGHFPEPRWAIYAQLRSTSDLTARTSLIDSGTMTSVMTSDRQAAPREPELEGSVLVPTDLDRDGVDELVTIGADGPEADAGAATTRFLRVLRVASGYLSGVFDVALPAPAPGCTFSLVHEASGDGLKVPRLGDDGACVIEIFRLLGGKLVKQ
ncbi:MAG: hypothetical protein IT370_24325 [Deltaproteobacteria bacterium]|nr:hypothetical protein [Deltaproteobacteria bacterium]